jgi:hypothetical protein
MPDLARFAECPLAVPWQISRDIPMQEVPDFIGLSPGIWVRPHLSAKLL